jgi:hypothetical protein
MIEEAVEFILEVTGENNDILAAVVAEGKIPVYIGIFDSAIHNLLLFAQKKGIIDNNTS